MRGKMKKKNLQGLYDMILSRLTSLILHKVIISIETSLFKKKKASIELFKYINNKNAFFWFFMCKRKADEDI